MGEAGDERIRAAVEKSIPLLEASGRTYRESRECFSCHHQAVPVLALTIAREHGFTVSSDEIKAQAKHTLADLATARETYLKGHSQGGGATRAGYALWTLSLAGLERDETTDAVAFFLSQRDQSLGRWRTSSNRPPSEASDYTTTYVSLRALDAYGSKVPKELVEKRRSNAREWLESAVAKDNEERVFKLLGLIAAKADPEVLAKAAGELSGRQRQDGGWSQRDDGESDAYATSTALFALEESGARQSRSPALAKGIEFLLVHQADDGSWKVVSRSKPFQTYFESGFPYGKDQFISTSATAWATAVLARLVQK